MPAGWGHLGKHCGVPGEGVGSGIPQTGPATMYQLSENGDPGKSRNLLEPVCPSKKQKTRILS